MLCGWAMQLSCVSASRVATHGVVLRVQLTDVPPSVAERVAFGEVGRIPE